MIHTISIENNEARFFYLSFARPIRGNAYIMYETNFANMKSTSLFMIQTSNESFLLWNSMKVPLSSCNHHFNRNLLKNLK